MLVPLLIYAVLPLLAVCVVARLIPKCHQEKVPVWYLGSVTFFYLGWVLVICTELFWRWSALASVGTIVLLFLGIPISLFIAFQLRKSRRGIASEILSLSAVYPVLIGASIFVVSLLA
jgi:hypothetical protein